jgi:hypothetical protein
MKYLKVAIELCIALSITRIEASKSHTKKDDNTRLCYEFACFVHALFTSPDGA